MRTGSDRRMLLSGVVLLATGLPAWAVTPTGEEIARAHGWAGVHFGTDTQAPSAEPPFSFVYAGKASNEFLKSWKVERQSRKLDGGKVERANTYTDPATGLVVRCVAVEYGDFPTVEWTLYFKNSGQNDTPIIADVQAMDLRIQRAEAGDFTLHYHHGDDCTANSYAPFVETLGSGASKQFAAAGGRPTNGQFPYWNVELAGDGMIAVLGWAGQWSAKFERDGEKSLRIRGGQELTHFKLLPGEEIRSPLVVVQYYQGDWIRGQNLWRRWMFKHNFPKLDGRPLRPFASACNGNHYPGIITHAAEELHFMRRYLEENVKPDFWWEDAGWYKCGDPPAWPNTGTWEVDPARWPKGIREVSDWCRERGIKTIVWFEPERVAAGYWLAENRPEWVLGGKNGGLLNLGIPECRQWITDRIDKIITEEGIDLYRQDFNINPLDYWRGNDAPDRKGITEIRHVEGYFAFWDELKKRHNGMLIDSCASGGRRNDVETLRRAVPLLRSDYLFEPIGEQGHTYGISFWIPFSGTGFITFDQYLIRSVMGPEFTLGVDTRQKDADYPMLRRCYEDWKRVAPCYFGDYYPLTPYSLAKNAWIGWQFDLPESGTGMIQVFRREECPDEAITVKLSGLDPHVNYIVESLDTTRTDEASGQELMEIGLRLSVPDRPGSALIAYQKAGQQQR